MTETCYEYSHLKAGKLRRRTLSPEQAGLMRLAIANHRKLKKLLRAWEVQPAPQGSLARSETARQNSEFMIIMLLVVWR